MAFRSDGHLRCPHCLEAALSRKTVLHIPRYECRGCEGLWLSSSGLQALQLEFDFETPLNLGTATGVTSDRSCPSCQRPLAIHIIIEAEIHIAIDVCVQHGVWLDKTELEQTLAVFLARRDQLRAAARAEHPWWGHLLPKAEP